jgi:Cu/Ag efflux pump CusA
MKSVIGTTKVKVPAGYELVWSGQYEFMERVAQRLKLDHNSSEGEDHGNDCRNEFTF